MPGYIREGHSVKAGWPFRVYGTGTSRGRDRNIASYYFNPDVSKHACGHANPSRRGSGAYIYPPEGRHEAVPWSVWVSSITRNARGNGLGRTRPPTWGTLARSRRRNEIAPHGGLGPLTSGALRLRLMRPARSDSCRRDKGVGP